MACSIAVKRRRYVRPSGVRARARSARWIVLAVRKGPLLFFFAVAERTPTPAFLYINRILLQFIPNLSYMTRIR